MSTKDIILSTLGITLAIITAPIWIAMLLVLVVFGGSALIAVAIIVGIIEALTD